jgi:hypothetical protein
MKKQQRLKIISLFLFFSFILTACPIDDERDDRPLSNWTAVSKRVVDSAVWDIIFVNEMFIAVGGNIATSQDGKNWTVVASDIFGTYESEGLSHIIYTITFGAGIYVACSYGGKIAWSEDLKNWTVVEDSKFGMNIGSSGSQGQSIRSITYGNGKFVAVGYNGKIAFSEDGKSWTAVKSPFTETIWAVTFTGESFLASDGRKSFLSQDGITWQQAEKIPRFFSIAFGNGIFVYASSPNVKITYGGGYFVAVGEHFYGGQIAWSEDGENWVEVKNTTFGSDAISNVAYGNGIFVVGGAMGKIAYSRPIN